MKIIHKLLNTLILIAICLVFLEPLEAICQTKKGINFANTKNWNEVLELAQKEQKIVFVDAFTTWCGPCKKMEADVYPNSIIGNYVNQNFIPIKIQFDKTDNDSELTKQWYKDAESLMKRYHIEAFPTFLFISADGTLIHNETGFQDTTKFLALVKKANDPKANFAGLIRQFENNQLKNYSLIELALKAKDNGLDSVALEIAKVYKKRQLDRFRPSILSTPNFINFISKFESLFTVNDKFVSYLYNSSGSADTILRSKGSSKLIYNYFIRKEYINPALKPHGAYVQTTPDWKNIQEIIQNKYDALTAKVLVLDAKIEWFNYKKEWKHVIRHTIAKNDITGLDTTGMGSVEINNFVFYKILKYSKDGTTLKKGAEYMETILKNNPMNDFWLDTYAGILYKLGRKKDALKNENIAIESARKRNDINAMKQYGSVLHKMENNEAIW